MNKLERIKALYTTKAVNAPVSRGQEAPLYFDRLASLDPSGRILMRFKKQRVLVEAVKKITERKCEGEKKGYLFWSAPFTLQAMYYLRTGNFRFTPELIAREEQATRRLKLNLDFDVPGLQKTPFAYQHEGVAFLEAYVDAYGGAILGDEPGLGKTAQFIAYLQRHPEDRPALIVCPASLKLNWAKEILNWMSPTPENRVYVLSGMTRQVCERVTLDDKRLVLTPCDVPRSGIFIINYNIVIDWCYLMPDDSIRFSIPDIKIIAFDEAQALKNPKTLQASTCIKLGKAAPKVIPITGTLIENKVQESFAALNLVRPDLFPSYFKFNEKYNKETRTPAATKELHHFISLSCIRRKKKDVLKDLPPKIKSVVPLTITNSSEYRTAEDNVITWIRGAKGHEAAERALQITGLARLNALKELAVKGKLDACIKWIEDYLESGEKLIVFAEHTHVVHRVWKHFGKKAVMVDGSVTKMKRNDAVEAFQNDPSKVLFVGQIKAAGVGLTLTAASATATLQLVWNPAVHEQADDRAHRIGQTQCVNNYYLMAEGTIEEDLAYLLDEKYQEASLVLDGEEPVSTDLLSAIMRRLKERRDK